MLVTLRPIPHRQKQTLVNLASLYVYDLSDIVGIKVNEEGFFDCDNTDGDDFWTEPNHDPYFIDVGGDLAGFAMVDDKGNTPDTDWNIAEFFVLRNYRRQGIGEAVAVALFDRYRGRWEVLQIPKNTPATAFWRKVIGRYTDDRYTETVEPLVDFDNQPAIIQRFDNRAFPGLTSDRASTHLPLVTFLDLNDA